VLVSWATVTMPFAGLEQTVALVPTSSPIAGGILVLGFASVRPRRG